MDNKNKNRIFSFRVSDDVATVVDNEVKKKKVTRTQWLEDFFMPKFKRLVKKTKKTEVVNEIRN